MMLQKILSHLATIPRFHLQLAPLEKNMIPELVDALFHPDTFFVKHRGYATKEIVAKIIEDRLLAQQKNESLTLVAYEINAQEICGMSSFLNPSPTEHKLEVGFTWIAQKFQKTFANAELKYQMLNSAFKNNLTKRIEFFVDPENTTSLKAMRSMGAVYEGTLRNVRFNSTTDKGDRSIFGIIDSDWPRVEKILLQRIHATEKVQEKKPSYIGNYRDFFQPDHAHYPHSDELLSIGSPIGKLLGLTHFGIHVELLPPNRRTSWPHAESEEEEFVMVLEGVVQVWLDHELFDLLPGDFVALPAGTGIAHTFINNSNKRALLLVGGDCSKATNKVFYPLHPERNLEMKKQGKLWENLPSSSR